MATSKDVRDVNKIIDLVTWYRGMLRGLLWSPDALLDYFDIEELEKISFNTTVALQESKLRKDKEDEKKANQESTDPSGNDIQVVS